MGLDSSTLIAIYAAALSTFVFGWEFRKARVEWSRKLKVEIRLFIFTPDDPAKPSSGSVTVTITNLGRSALYASEPEFEYESDGNVHRFSLWKRVPEPRVYSAEFLLSVSEADLQSVGLQQRDEAIKFPVKLEHSQMVKLTYELTPEFVGSKLVGRRVVLRAIVFDTLGKKHRSEPHILNLKH